MILLKNISIHRNVVEILTEWPLNRIKHVKNTEHEKYLPSILIEHIPGKVARNCIKQQYAEK